ncbi:hypothetical protein GYMLUDRAFT_37386 [Collybiopsis luxurians FD-317 M1]|nr:hypothetical protein GYMLUDRAFT_37386 [Collybiopsis luxurians FD-317 M1]
MPPSTNLNLLTQSHSAIASKKRAKRSQIKEVIFDDVARHEFLTGFHKRKVAQKEGARKRAIEREKQQRQQDRREQRRMLRERAAENAAEVEKAYGASEEWQGITESDEQNEEEGEENQYEGEDVLATVAIVQDFDPDTLLHGPTKPVSNVEPVQQMVNNDSLPSKASHSHPSKVSHSQPSKKTKSKKIRYETKAARKTERTRQRTRRTEKAELAGGKASRRKSKRRS